MVAQAEVAAYRKRMNPVGTATASGRSRSAAQKTLARCIRYHAGLWTFVGRREAAGCRRGKQHTQVSQDQPREGEKGAPMADINVQHPTLLRRRAAPGSQACDASARMDMADATVMEGHEGCAWGRRVGKGREVCLSWASVPEGESSACVSASVPGPGGPAVEERERASIVSCCG